MKYLYRVDYAAMIYEILKANLSLHQASDYFFSQYSLYSNQNRNFINELRATIDYTITERQRIINDSINGWDGFEWFEGMDGDLPFVCIYKEPEEGDLFYELKKHGYSFNENVTLNLSDCENLKIAYDNFSHQAAFCRKEEAERKFTVSEYVLAYMFELYAAGENIPMNPVEGTICKNKIMNIGSSRYSLKGDTFYRKVKEIKEKFDINSKEQLEQISRDWQNAVKKICSDWEPISKYLQDKGLI